ncbi:MULTISPECIES: CDP-glycerol glycerophosphotransferase family protein [unclassified Campylobacter]|uniref:CDP-glycerol glycerophosphotransferase family protein n=1 Tax=unclassified Campylobacter TaxID=2593542 RepID=UPI0022E9B61F|nr:MULTISPECIES: CDP-glycerol glycerophosphotransferase family protein [unclassified Campylobacter]MDA3043933.1 CDP-glycerol glycerophosphotransferase family protein [Campylobacter sp. JMF_09 ED2]MDA3045470.1 CDP-glycerol glycerophosphotransferase family protein [Campylobacter sp. JMF_07 ED4]MDA3064110.1 CDP-glycerol glycerophosphotransferase family protein [Campylobacter sp. JMF_11 EL3]MDA3072018.1 CDP-glycerol glycerophosphotransferase family protein [Campylobacter sp. VBCF_03 NA9]MDA3075717
MLLKKIFQYLIDGTLFVRLKRRLFILFLPKFFNLLKSKTIKNNKIVLSNFDGSGYSDNPKYIAEYIISNNLDYELVWLVDKNKNIDKSMFPKEIKIVESISFSALQELSSAKIWIDNTRKIFYPKKKKEQIYIQTWHGLFALKMIEKDATSLPESYIKKAKLDSANIDLILSGCKFKTKIFQNSFWYDGEVAEFGTPRTDIFFDKAKIKNAKKKIYDFYGIDENTKILLYAPTFRKTNSLEPYLLDYSALLKTIQNEFGGKWIILVRLHPNLAFYMDKLNISKDVINASFYMDSQELLCASETVISDYSSIVFDYFLLNRPVFLFCTDLQDYTKNDRDFYINIDELPFDLAENNSELLKNIKNFQENLYKIKIQNFQEKYGFIENGLSCKNMFEWIENEKE